MVGKYHCSCVFRKKLSNPSGSFKNIGRRLVTKNFFC